MYIVVLVLTVISLLFSSLPSFPVYAQVTCAKHTSGDANCDNIINLNDFEVWRKEFSGTITTTTSDFDNSQNVTIADFEIWRTGYFQPSTTVTSTTTPTIIKTPTVTVTKAPTVTVTKVPTITTTITPTPSTGTSPSGQAMPVGDLPGWKQIFTEDFKSNVTVGNFPGTIYKAKWDVYPDGWPDTAGKRGGPSRYYPSKVVSVTNGILNKKLHTENGTPMAAALLPILPGHTSSRQGQKYGKYTVRFRADSLAGFKTAWLLWPDSNTWPRDGEIDFPEGDLASTIKAFMHRQNGVNGGDQDAYSTGITYTAWHTASIEWTATKLTFILDGKNIGISTSRIPSTSMHWVLQTEACLPTCPAATTTGNVQIDWVAIYAPN